MSHYATGTRFEHKTRDDLIANGYDVVRAAGSKGSTKADLIGFKPGQLLLVQCKRSGALPPAEWDRLVEVAGWVGAVPVLAANGPAGRGVVYTRLLGPKRRGCRTQPCAPFLLDELAATEPAATCCPSRRMSTRAPGGLPCEHLDGLGHAGDHRHGEATWTDEEALPPVGSWGDERSLPVPAATVTLPGVA